MRSTSNGPFANERAKVVVEVGKLKSKTDQARVRPGSGDQVLEKVVKANQGPLSDVTIKAIWRELMSGSFLLEKPLRIGYLVHKAASVTPLPCSSSARAWSMSP